MTQKSNPELDKMIANDLLHAARDRLESFKQECDANEHTDVGEAWEVMHLAWEAINAHLTPRKDILIDKVCQECGGPVTFEGWISWDVDAQEFVVDDVCDKGHQCGRCGGSTYARDVEYKPYCIEVIPTAGNEIGVPRSAKTFRFDTREEVQLFHYGMRTGAKLVSWDVSYTDEEA